MRLLRYLIELCQRRYVEGIVLMIFQLTTEMQNAGVEINPDVGLQS